MLRTHHHLTVVGRSDTAHTPLACRNRDGDEVLKTMQPIWVFAPGILLANKQLQAFSLGIGCHDWHLQIPRPRHILTISRSIQRAASKLVMIRSPCHIAQNYNRSRDRNASSRGSQLHHPLHPTEQRAVVIDDGGEYLEVAVTHPQARYCLPPRKSHSSRVYVCSAR